MTASLDQVAVPVPAAGTDHDAEAAIVREGQARQDLQLALARWLIKKADYVEAPTVTALIEDAALENGASGASAAEVFWELVRLRVLDAQGRLRPRSAYAAR